MMFRLLGHRVVLLVSVLVVLAIASSIASQRPVTTGEEFRKASWEDKRITIVQITLNQLSLPVEQMVDILGAALDDPDPNMRGGALSTIVSRAGAPWISRGDDRIRAWEREHVPLRSLRPSILTALTTDPEPRVREAAVGALASLDFDLKERRSSPLPETETILVGRYYAEPEGRVRAAIVSGFSSDRAALSDGVEGLLKAAFKDPDKRVRDYAAAGAARLDPAVAMPYLAQTLKDEDAGIRLQSALTFAKFGPQATEYLATLKAAEAREADPRVRQAIGHTIAAIDQRQSAR